MLKKYRILLIIILTAITLIFYNPQQIAVPVEKTNIPSGIAVDYIEGETGQNYYMLSSSVYTFNKKDQIESMILYGNGLTIPQTRQGRQLQSNQKNVIALEKAVIFSENYSKSGIMNSLDILFGNHLMNDMGWLVVCKGKAIDILKHKVDQYPSSADYISSMVENSKEQNFFSNNYKMMDMYVRVDSEGRNLVLPYIEAVNGNVEITGLALFKKDKMVKKIDIKETKILNILREKKANGILEIIESPDKVISSYGPIKRKVSCNRSDSKYSFTIDLSYKCNVLTNSLYKDFQKDPKMISKYEKDLEQQTEKQCQDFIKKMQNEYRVDCLELGREACAKYGRNTGVDWDKIISDSDINVNVKVKVEGFGRGMYGEIK